MKLACLMTGAALMLGPQTAPVTVDVPKTTETQPVVIKTPEELVKQFLTEKVEETVNGKTETREQVISQVTDLNYEGILKAQEFLDKADDKFKEETAAFFKEHKIDFEKLVKDAQDTKARLEPETEEEKAETEPETEAAPETEEETTPEPEGSLVVEETLETETKAEPEVKAEAKPEEQPAAEAEKVIPAAHDNKEEQQPVAMVTTPVQPQNTANTSAASSFVNQYLMNGSGQLYSSVTSANCQQILGSLSAWNGLSDAAKSEVNARLASNGTTYNRLVAEAQKLSTTNTAVRPAVHTAVACDPGFFVGLGTGSMSLLAGLFKSGRWKKAK